jgi:hypothetical protein
VDKKGVVCSALLSLPLGLKPTGSTCLLPVACCLLGCIAYVAVINGEGVYLLPTDSYVVMQSISCRGDVAPGARPNSERAGARISE